MSALQHPSYPVNQPPSSVVSNAFPSPSPHQRVSLCPIIIQLCKNSPASLCFSMNYSQLCSQVNAVSLRIRNTRRKTDPKNGLQWEAVAAKNSTIQHPSLILYITMKSASARTSLQGPFACLHFFMQGRDTSYVIAPAPFVPAC